MSASEKIALTITEIGGLLHVTRSSGANVLAVFRVRNDGKPKKPGPAPQGAEGKGVVTRVHS